MGKLIKILSIDGGGIRGIIPALWLAEIEKKTQKSLPETFDLVAGTSTGGILALGLTMPNDDGNPKYTAEEFVRIYEMNGSAVFPKFLFKFAPVVKYLQKIGLIDEKYPEKFINKIFEDIFKSARLKDSLTDVLITAYEIEKRIPFFFKSRKAKVDSRHDFLMKNAAYAASAAPTYFNPLKTSYFFGHLVLVDGGTYVNNPALCALMEAKKLYPEAEDFLVVSLGTGNPSRKLDYEKAKNWKRADWARKVIDIANHGSNDTVDYQLKNLLPENRYFRFQITLKPENEAIDNATPENISALKKQAMNFIEENSAVLDDLIEILADNRLKLLK